MIEPLRSAHRRVFIGLAVLLPAILFIGIEGRANLSASPRVKSASVRAETVRESTTLWRKHAIKSKFYSESEHPQEIYLVLEPATEWNEPDLLLYSTTTAPQGNSLPGNAKLAGAYQTGKAFVLPLNDDRESYLILFSTANQSVFDTAKVEKLR